MSSATNPFADRPHVSGGPCDNATAVTTSDTNDLAVVTRALYIGVSGDVVAIVGGNSVTFKAVPVGYLPVCASRIKATGTRATNIIALW